MSEVVCIYKLQQTWNGEIDLSGIVVEARVKETDRTAVSEQNFTDQSEFLSGKFSFPAGGLIPCFIILLERRAGFDLPEFGQKKFRDPIPGAGFEINGTYNKTNPEPE